MNEKVSWILNVYAVLSTVHNAAYYKALTAFESAAATGEFSVIWEVI
jgi:hypothetical protein